MNYSGQQKASGQTPSPRNSVDIWAEAIRKLRQWDKNGGKLNELLEGASFSEHDTTRRELRWIVYGILRHCVLIDAIMARLAKKAPRSALKQLLRIAIHEIIQHREESSAPVVHFAVEQAKNLKFSEKECRFVNALLRRASEMDLTSFPPQIRWSHPDWLYERWVNEFGNDAAQQLMKWNQEETSTYLNAPGLSAAGNFKETPWPGFYKVDAGTMGEALELIHAGKAYIQDPATRLPVELLNPHSGEQVLDLCAAPGGKSWQIAGRLGDSGRVVSVDLPGSRSARLRENLAHFPDATCRVVESALENLEAALKKDELPQTYEAVLLDAPCSNTGVIRRKPDVKLRLSQEDMASLPEQQLGWIECAALFVAPGGRLVYSTCSIEEVENSGVVTRFLERHPEFQLRDEVLSYPWERGHDGGGAFLLIKNFPEI